MILLPSVSTLGLGIYSFTSAGPRSSIGDEGAVPARRRREDVAGSAIGWRLAMIRIKKPTVCCPTLQMSNTWGYGWQLSFCYWQSEDCIILGLSLPGCQVMRLRPDGQFDDQRESFSTAADRNDSEIRC
ncbi:hypothetical protein SAMN04489724_0860 [Algoriphagus locisalis]|uniref:Uncharacterized protein n=1 Tax=Algoriphagus locisalis TaxID=305507 RepID=A0A1I6Y7C1_9BACT|nr:hypothetical protein SAMN04489724_0860 [Algoriphagus locisalis]